MTAKQTHTLLAWQYAKTHAFHPAIHVTSRRSAHHPSVGKVYKNSRVVSEVNINYDYNKGNWRNQI